MEAFRSISPLMPNKRAPGKGGIPSLFHTGRARPALPEHERWAPTCERNRMRLSILSSMAIPGCALVLLTGCFLSTDKSRDVLRISCAPQQVEEGGTAILTILQISPAPLTRIVGLKDDTFINAAHYGQVLTEASGPGSPSAYRLQVIEIHPLPGQTELQLGPADLENLPAGFIMHPIKIKVVPRAGDDKQAPGRL